MACFGVANDEIPIRSTITLYSGALPLATGSDISPKCTVPGRQQSLFRELLLLAVGNARNSGDGIPGDA